MLTVNILVLLHEQRIYKERKALTASLADMSSAISKLDGVLLVVALVICIFIVSFFGRLKLPSVLKFCRSSRSPSSPRLAVPSDLQQDKHR